MTELDIRITKLVDEGLSIRQIGADVCLSYTAVRYHLNKLSLKTKNSVHLPNRLKCTVCQQPLIGRQTHYCSQKCKTIAVGNCYEYQKARAIYRKKLIITLKGGKCGGCGYSKNLAAMELHHNDPQNKSFQLDARHLSNSSMERIFEELTKCVLLCANCHREYHNPELTNWNNEGAPSTGAPSSS